MKFSEEFERLEMLKERANDLRTDISLLMLYRKKLQFRDGLIKLSEYMRDDIAVDNDVDVDSYYDQFIKRGINLDNINDVIDAEIKKLNEINGAAKAAQEEMGDEYDRYKAYKRGQGEG